MIMFQTLNAPGRMTAHIESSRPRLLYEQVGGDQAAAEEHGDDKEGVEDLFAAEIGQGHGVGRQHGDHHRDDGKEHRVEDGVF